MASKAEKETSEEKGQAPAAVARKRARTKVKKKATRRAVTGKKGVRRRTSAPTRKTVGSQPKKSRKYRRYSDAERNRILAAARKGKLTGAQVQKRFGITTVTYYSWRKKAGTKRGPGRPIGAVVISGGGGNLSGQVRGEVQARIRAMLPEIVRTEVGRYLDSVFGSSGKRR
jgi:transposase-like protein